MTTYMAFYRKFRPLIFSDVVGQGHIVQILKHQIKNNMVGHAYLFCGTRGTGKTTTAKIFSRAINCLSPIDGEPCNECLVCKGILSASISDVMEIDAASNNGVENIRSIRENVIYAPAMAKYKVYIIDEVHMLSSSAFNALLKTLEEPPENVVFILATTEPHKIPVTILSRCQRFEFKRITIPDIVKRLEFVCKENNAEYDISALTLIAHSSEGALRDAISLLDQVISSGVPEVNEQAVRENLGLTDSSSVSSLLSSILGNDTVSALSIVNDVVNSGADIKYFVWEIISLARDILVYNTTKEKSLVTSFSFLQSAGQFSLVPLEKLIGIISYLSKVENQIKNAAFPNILLEASLIELISGSAVKPVTTIQKNSDTKARTKQISVNTIEKAPTPKKDTPIAEGAPIWQDVITYLKNSGKMSLYATLVSANVVFSDNTAKIYFSQPFGKVVIEKSENLKTLKDAILAVCGKEYDIKCFTEEKEKSSSSLDELENTLINSGIDVSIE